jgi:hypothetical protein
MSFSTMNSTVESSIGEFDLEASETNIKVAHISTKNVLDEDGSNDLEAHNRNSKLRQSLLRRSICELVIMILISNNTGIQMQQIF